MNSLLNLFHFIHPFVSNGQLQGNKVHKITRLPKMKTGQKLTFCLIVNENEEGSHEAYLKILYDKFLGLNFLYYTDPSFKSARSKLNDLMSVNSFLSVIGKDLCITAKKPISLQLYEVK